MPVVKPSGTAFDDALDYFVLVPPQLRAEHYVVHAICEIRGKRFAHAWVEYMQGSTLYRFEGVLVDGARGYRCHRPEAFEKLFSVEQSTRYTFAEVLALNERHNNFGPWLPEYLALCEARPS